MRYFVVFLSATLVFLSIGNATINAAEDVYHNPQELFAVSRAYDFNANGGHKGLITFEPDKTLAVELTNGFSDTATWRAKDTTTFCWTWKKRHGGKENCYNIRNLSDDRIQMQHVETRGKGAVLKPKN